jgi:hypothetical protein
MGSIFHRPFSFANPANIRKRVIYRQPAFAYRRHIKAI